MVRGGEGSGGGGQAGKHGAPVHHRREVRERERESEGEGGHEVPGLCGQAPGASGCGQGASYSERSVRDQGHQGRFHALVP